METIDNFVATLNGLRVKYVGVSLEDWPRCKLEFSFTRYTFMPRLDILHITYMVFYYSLIRNAVYFILSEVGCVFKCFHAW